MSRTHLGRRDLVRAAGGLAAGAALGRAATPATAQQGLGSWFSNVSNFDGVVDERGRSEVTVDVGVAANQGAFGFAPAAVRVDPGTTVVWEWTGQGGQHNVVTPSGDVKSELVREDGHTFSHTFESTGVVRYLCGPHEGLGMKGAVVVGDVSVDVGAATGTSSTTTAEGTTEPSATAEEPSEPSTPTDGSRGSGDDAAYLVGGGLLGALVSPVLFGLFVRLAGTEEE